MYEYDDLFWSSLDRSSFTPAEWEQLKAQAVRRARVVRSRTARRMIFGAVARLMRRLVLRRRSTARSSTGQAVPNAR